RNALIEEGNLLFGKYGFQKTSITDITKKVGIAQGTFYNFFNSKELLYFAILELEENKLTKQLLEINFSKESSAKEIMKQKLQKLIKVMKTNEIISELFVYKKYKKLVRNV